MKLLITVNFVRCQFINLFLQFIALQLVSAGSSL
jgi:hypothetical protein